MQRSPGFTLVELILVMTITLILVGLTIGTSGYVQTKAKRSRAEAELAAISTALENYKADNGTYPIDTDNGSTNGLDPRTMFDPMAIPYSAASLFLYKELSGDPTGNRFPTGRSYFTFKSRMLLPRDSAQSVAAIADPFGYSYGYSTAAQTDPNKGYNPTFDLWSTSGRPQGVNPQERWIRNW